jgi:hypothetical protein
VNEIGGKRGSGASGFGQGGRDIVVERQVRVIAAMVGFATLGAAAWLFTAGSAVASASTRLRSGNLHAQLVSHVSPGASAVSSGLGLKGSDVMSAVVATMAVLAVAFLIVTFIRRRITAS